MSNFIRISEAASIAFHTAAYLALDPGRLASSREIAGAIGASTNHVSKVLQRLAHAGFVESTRGPRGGFRIRQGWERIRLIDLYEAIEGPITPTRCLLDHPLCRGNRCPLGALVHETNESARKILGGTMLPQLTRSFIAGRNGRRAAKKTSKKKPEKKGVTTCTSS